MTQTTTEAEPSAPDWDAMHDEMLEASEDGLSGDVYALTPERAVEVVKRHMIGRVPVEVGPRLLDRAIYIAAGAHNGQIDKAGAPYIHHVLRVMLAMDTEAERVVAVLHDLLEDCPDWTAERLAEAGIPAWAVEAVQALTRGEDEGYDAFVLRVAKNPLAAAVKRADLMDNMDLTRLPNPGPGDRQRVRKYERALATLSDPNQIRKAGQG